jgi:hypothetical protein
MTRFEGQVLTQIGTPLSGTTVTVRVANVGAPGTGALATLYSDNGVTPTTNPVTADSNARYWFYIADGKYDITFSGTGITTYTRGNIEIADLTSANSGGSDWAANKVNVTTGVYIGATPSLTGAIGLSNGGTVKSRNAANSADITLMSLDATNVLNLYGTGLLVDSSGNVAIGGTAASAEKFLVKGLQRLTGMGTSPAYGSLMFNSSAFLSAGSRRRLLVNWLSGRKFAIIRGTDASTDPTMDGGGNITAGTADFLIDETGIVEIPNRLLIGGGTNSSPNSIYFGTSNPPFIFVDQINTGTQILTVQAGRGSASYGGSLILYGHAHGTNPGWVRAGISNGSGGKFAVNSQALGGGTDVFTVTAAGDGVFASDVTATGLIVSGAISHAGTVRYIDAGGGTGIQYNVPTSAAHKFSINGVTKLQLDGAVRCFAAAGTNSAVLLSGSDTAYHIVQATSTGGNGIFGVNTSTGTGLLANATAYSAILGSLNATPLELFTNTVVRIKIADAGTTFYTPADKVGTASIITDSAGINTTETVVVKSGTLAANRLVAGTVIRAVLEGTCTASAANTSTFQIRIGTAGTTADTLVFSGVTAASAVTGTAVPFRAILELTVRTVGVSATATGFLTIQTTGGTATGISTIPVQVILPTMTAFNTTTASNIISATYKSAATTTTCTFKQAFIEVVYL